MSHVTDRLAEFVFEELSSQEMAEANRHLNACSACREQVDRFQTTLAMLKTSADVEPPRRMLFEFEKRPAGAWLWRWLAPMAASAAVALAVVTLVPRQQPPAQPQIVQREVSLPPSQAAAQPVDYQRILNELRASDQQWLADELKKRDAAHAVTVQRLQAQMASLDYYQRQIEHDTWENSRDVQLLAARTDGRE